MTIVVMTKFSKQAYHFSTTVSGSKGKMAKVHETSCLHYYLKFHMITYLLTLGDYKKGKNQLGVNICATRVFCCRDIPKFEAKIGWCFIEHSWYKLIFILGKDLVPKQESQREKRQTSRFLYNCRQQ